MTTTVQQLVVHDSNICCQHSGSIPWQQRSMWLSMSNNSNKLAVHGQKFWQQLAVHAAATTVQQLVVHDSNSCCQNSGLSWLCMKATVAQHSVVHDSNNCAEVGCAAATAAARILTGVYYV
jgi:hypothetical protein